MRSDINRFVRITIIAVLALLIVPTGLMAQSQASTGQIAGTVKDAGGATIPDASVKVTNTATGFTQTVTTTNDGLYRAVLLPPGTYTVEISKTGFATNKANVEVNVGRTAEVNAALAVGDTTNRSPLPPKPLKSRGTKPKLS